MNCSPNYYNEIICMLRSIACTLSSSSTQIPTFSCLQITEGGNWGEVGDTIQVIRWFNPAQVPPIGFNTVFINNRTGLVVTDVDDTNSIPCTTSGSSASEYLICDDGVQKIVRVCWDECEELTVSYWLLDRTESSEPEDWDAVTGGPCSAGMVDDTPFTPGTSQFMPAGGNYRASRDQVNNGDGGAFDMTINRALYVTIETPNANSAMDETLDAVRVNIVGSDVLTVGSITTSVTPGVAASNLGKAEDAPHTSGDVGVMSLAVRNDLGNQFTGADLDYTPFSVNRYGTVYVDIDANHMVTPSTTSIIKQEDDQTGSGHVGVGVLNVQQSTPTNDVSANNDYQFFKGNIVGAVYNEPANQVATWAAATVAGAAGGVTTTGANLLTNSAKVKRVEVLNTTDQIVQISLDAGTTWVLTAPATTGVAYLDLGANGRWSASNIHVRSIGSDTSSGSVYLSVMI